MVFAGDDQRIEEVERRGLDPHDGFAGPGGRLGYFHGLKFVRRAEMGTEDGFHGGLGLFARRNGRQSAGAEFLTTKYVDQGSRQSNHLAVPPDRSHASITHAFVAPASSSTRRRCAKASRSRLLFADFVPYLPEMG
jgi:hypothetical protein